MDKVCISGLQIDTVIGVFEWERKVRQSVYLDVQMAWDIKAAAGSDDLSLTLDYQAVANRLTEFVSESEFQLIETMAEKSAELLMSEFKIPWLKMTVSKPTALERVKNVSVIIERGKLLNVESF